VTARYVYCLVDPTGNDPGTGTGAETGTGTAASPGDDAGPPTLETTGLEGAPVRVVTADAADADGADSTADADEADSTADRPIAAVVHDCESLYDTDDEAELRRWLLAHQRVVDEATDAFGTPLPVRFDTVIEGGDDALADWLASVGDAVRGGLADLAGCREYRTFVHWTGADEFEARVRERDDRLAELAAEREAASPGRGFLVGKQYDARLRELRRERVEELATALREAVAPVARAVEETDAGTLDGADVEGEPVARLAVLAAAADEARLGNRLDDYVADRPVTVRFTGPWAPYSFAPDLG
jgi:hypothetical protein